MSQLARRTEQRIVQDNVLFVKMSQHAVVAAGRIGSQAMVQDHAYSPRGALAAEAQDLQSMPGLEGHRAETAFQGVLRHQMSGGGQAAEAIYFGDGGPYLLRGETSLLRSLPKDR